MYVCSRTDCEYFYDLNAQMNLLTNHNFLLKLSNATFA